MRKRICLVVVTLLLAIGFAAISTSLIINGNTKVSENTEDFSVIFTSASLDGTDVYANVVSQDKKTITFETSELKTLNQTSVLAYEVTNNSANYDAEVQVNCNVKENTTAKYTSITNELENNATVVKAKETLGGTLTVTLDKVATEEVKENYVCTLTFNAVERNELGQGIPDPISFTTDSWETIQNAVQTGNTEVYNVGDTKVVDLGTLGTHTVRISNKSECTNGETSETACGFVVEFADIITEQPFNSTNTNVGGWKDSELRTYINNTIYKSLPSDLQNVITTTKVISSHGSTSGETNFETQDKLYLLSAHEVWEDGTSNQLSANDTAYSNTKQLDYYKNQGVTTPNYAGARKQYNGGNLAWWLRSASSDNTNYFLRVGNIGDWNYFYASTSYGVSPAFRIALAI